MQSLPTCSSHIPLPALPGNVIGEPPRSDPRLTPRAFHLSEPFPIALALLQYFYSLALITPLQHAPAVLSQLLVLSSTYSIPHLESLVKHVMHRALSNSTSLGVYEVATLCGCRSLQIRYVSKLWRAALSDHPMSCQSSQDGHGKCSIFLSQVRGLVVLISFVRLTVSDGHRDPVGIVRVDRWRAMATTTPPADDL